MCSEKGALLDIVGGAGLIAPPPREHPTLEPASAKDYHFDPQRTVAMFAEEMARLHSLDVNEAAEPVLTMGAVVELARATTEAAPDAPLDAAYRHMSRRELLGVLDAGLDRLGEVADSALVVTHGTPELGVFMCEEGTAVGLIRWDAIAVADRHRDLARVAASLVSDMGPMMLPEFFERYGSHPDPLRLDWWLLAAQLLPAPQAAN